MSTSARSSFLAPSPGIAGDDRDGSGAAEGLALDDLALVKLFNAGDEAAFEEIVGRHQKRMFAIAYAILKNRADAEEIAQDVFIQAHRGLAAFRCEASLATWLYKIAMNLSRNRYWYFFRRAHQANLSFDCPTSTDDQPAISELTASTAPDPARAAIEREISELIASCIQRLSPRAREILVLRYTLSQSYHEIAAELKISVGTVKSRIFRARLDLRSRMSETNPEFGRETKSADWFDRSRPSGTIAVL